MKKKSLLVLFTFVLSFVLVFAVACDNHEHEFGSWSITTQPTENTTGVATRSCTTCDKAEGVETVTLPVLTDATVWTKTAETPATHTTDGSRTYSSEYGTVTIKLEKGVGAHSYQWTLTTNPTDSAKGSAHGVCSCGDTTDVEVAVLTDTSVWTKDETNSVASTCAAEGKDVFTSIYGTVEVATAKAEHNYGSWTLTTDPTATTVGVATRVCANDSTHVETKDDVPVLTDTSVWTAEVTPADYNNPEITTYTSIYGTVTVTTGSKIVAPYDSKTYHSVNFDYNEVGKQNKALSAGTSWTGATLTVDANGVGTGEAYPFRGKFVFHLDDATTGKVTISVYNIVSSSSSSSSDDDEESWDDYDVSGYAMSRSAVEYATEVSSVIVGYVDMETGMLVLPVNSLGEEVNVCVPSDAELTASMFSAFNWSIATGIEVTMGDDTIGMLITADKVLFGVTFHAVDAEKLTTESKVVVNQIPANQCFSASQWTVVCSGENIVAIYVQNATTYVLADDVIGLYKGANHTVLLDGAGKIMILSGSDMLVGTYTVGENNIIGAMIYDNNGMGAYWNITLSGNGVATNGGTFTHEVVTATLTINTNGVEIVTDDFAGLDFITINSNGTIDVVLAKFYEMELPEIKAVASANKEFDGWYLDAACTQPVQLSDDLTFVLNSDMTIYAKWADAIVINLLDAKEADGTSFKIGVGQEIGSKLPNYTYGVTLNDDGTKYFDGWVIVLADNTTIALPSLQSVVSADDNGMNLRATWKDVPVYAGVYTGTEYRSVGWNSQIVVTLTIDNLGNIKCEIQQNGNTNASAVISAINGATVVGYDSATKKVTYKLNANDATERYFFFDATIGAIVGLAKDDNSIGADFHVLLRDGGEVSNRYIIAVSGNNDNNAQMLTINGTSVMFYLNKIYSNITITDICGNVLSVSDLSDSTSAIVVDNVANETVFAVGTTGSNLANSGVKALDNVYGVYNVTIGNDLIGETIIIDGLGYIVGASANYTIASGTTLDVYAYTMVDDQAVNTAYYTIVLDVENKTATVTKPVATITIVATGLDEGVTADDVVLENCNINMAVALQHQTVENHVFINYYSDEECTNLVTANYVPTTASVTIYAKFASSFTVTVVNNNGEENSNESVSAGGTMSLDIPTYAKHAFVGWYTTEDFQAGTEFVMGETVVSDNITIYAKWEDAPAYNNDYYYVRLDATSNVSGTSSISSSWNNNLLSVDVYGHAALSAMPFNGTKAQDIAWVNKSTGEISITVTKNDDSTVVYRAFVDAETGVIVMYDGGAHWILSPFEGKTGSNSGTFSASKISSSYWANGSARSAVYTYTDAEEVSHSVAMLILTDRVYFGDSFVDGEGNAVAGNACYDQTAITLKHGADTVVTLQLKVNITLVYGNGLENSIVEVYSNATLDLSAHNPAYTNGQLLDYWCTDAELENQFTATFVSENTTLYCKWKDAEPYEFVSSGSYPWTENNGVWTSGNYNISSSESELLIRIYADVLVKFDYAGSGEGGNYDNLFIYVNGTQKDKVGEKTDLSAITFKTFTLDAKASDVIRLVYKKDNSGNHNDDCGQIKNIVAIVYKPITLTYDYNGQGTTAKVVDMTAGDVVDALEPVDFTFGNKVFLGWFTDVDCTAGNEFTVGTMLVENTTVYAKWVGEVTLTVVYANAPEGKTNINAMANVTLTYPAGSTIAPVEPAFTDGMSFSHWSETADGDAIDWTVILENKTIYAVWMEAYATMGNYKGFNLYYSSEGTTSGTKQASSITSTATISADGKFKGVGISPSTEVQIESNYSTISEGVITIKNAYVYVNMEYGVIWYSYNGTNSTGCGTDTYLMMLGDVSKVDYSIVCNKNGSSVVAWAAWVTITYADDSTRTLFLYNDTIFAGATWTAFDSSLNPVAAKDAATKDIAVVDSNGADICANISKKIVIKDAYVGTYHTSGTDNAMVINGYGKITSITNATLGLTDATGTYTAATAEADYTFDVVIDGDNYELTLGADNTYTLVKPMFTVTFDLNGVTPDETIDSQSVNKGKKWTAVEDPTASGKIFKGWFKDAECSGSRVWYSETVTADITYYAKWVDEVTLTVNNSNGAGESTVLKYEAGQTVSLTSIALVTNGYMREGFYSNEACTEAYTPAAINENTEIWVKWNTLSVEGLTVDNSGTYTFVGSAETGYKSNNKGASSSTATMTLTATSACTVTISYTGSSEANYDKFSIATTGTGAGVSNVSGTSTQSGTATISLEAGQTITITYSKDSSGNGGSDEYTVYIVSTVIAE